MSCRGVCHTRAFLGEMGILDRLRYRDNCHLAVLPLSPNGIRLLRFRAPGSTHKSAPRGGRRQIGDFYGLVFPAHEPSTRALLDTGMGRTGIEGRTKTVSATASQSI